MLTIDRSPTLEALHDRFPGAIALPGDGDWDEARAAFNLLVDQQPAAVARPRTAGEAAEIVAGFRDAGLRIAPQGSGHNAAPLGSLVETAIVKLERMLGVTIDPVARIARVEAGARWWDVVPEAAKHGLSALHGSSPEINVVGYSLGGGVGWQGRKRGLQANSVTVIEIITADGELRRVDTDTEPDLFWALRGGGGNFGLVTAIEFRLYPLTEVYAGSLFFPYERSAEIFHAWREWIEKVPEELTSAVRMLQFPDLELIPELVRGKSFAVVGAAYLGDAEDGFELTRPLRALASELDTFGMVPAAALTELHMDPVEPMPYLSAHALLADLPAKAVDDLIAAAGPGTGSMLAAVELRHLGGALSRAGEGAGAAATMRGEYLGFGVGPVMAPEMAPAIEAQLDRVATAFAPYDSGRYLNFTEEPDDIEAMFPAGTIDRLRAVKSTYDPNDLFKANHQIPPA